MAEGSGSKLDLQEPPHNRQRHPCGCNGSCLLGLQRHLSHLKHSAIQAEVCHGQHCARQGQPYMYNATEALRSRVPVQSYQFLICGHAGDPREPEHIHAAARDRAQVAAHDHSTATAASLCVTVVKAPSRVCSRQPNRHLNCRRLHSRVGGIRCDEAWC